MKKADYFVDSHYKIGDVDPNLFASFIEHLGRGVYSGIYEPGHPAADENGFRQDVIELVKELGVPMIRYPGGNFVSSFNWVDSIGPKENRPRRLEYAWASVETNQFGIDEFADWSKQAGIEPMVAVNLGTGSIHDAGYFVEYCNHPGGTYWSDLRIKNGHKTPHGFKYWCLGNEMEGPWQAGHLSAEDYTKKAFEAAKIMKWVDPGIKLIASGSSYEMLPSYLEWDRTMLETLYDHIDYLSTHSYYMNSNLGTTNFLASYKHLDDHLKASQSVLDYVKAKKKSKKSVKICLDEWNVWNFSDIELSSLDDLNGLTAIKVKSAERWEVAPAILEEKYSLLDALTVGGLAITLLKNADKVKIACLAQLINVIAPITTKKGGGVLKQATYYPFMHISNYGRGEVIHGVTSAPVYESMYGELPVVEAVTIYNPEDQSVTIFALNCDQNEDVEFAAAINGFGNLKVAKHIVLDGPDLSLYNTFENPESVKPRNVRVPTDTGTNLKVILPKLSWNVLRITGK